MVKAVAEEATKKRVGTEFFKKYSVKKLSYWSDFDIGKSGRLTEPMILRPGSHHYEPIDWDEAFKIIADELKNLDNLNEALFIPRVGLAMKPHFYTVYLSGCLELTICQIAPICVMNQVVLV